MPKPCGGGGGGGGLLIKVLLGAYPPTGEVCVIVFSTSEAFSHMFFVFQ